MAEETHATRKQRGQQEGPEHQDPLSIHHLCHQRPLFSYILLVLTAPNNVLEVPPRPKVKHGCSCNPYQAL